MSNANNWTFQQLAGEKKKLELTGYQAPFGRPRKKPVMKELVKSRVHTTYYVGSSAPPTRNSFGTHWEPIELSGRWMDNSPDIGATTANDMASQWTNFVRDEQTIRISWGWITSFIGFIEELELARESETQIAWRMKILIDQREDVSQRSFVKVFPPIKDDLSDLNKFLASSAVLQAPAVPDMGLDFFDSLALLAGSVNSLSASLNKLVGQFDDIEKATFGAIANFRSAVTGIGIALQGMRDVILNASIDSIMVVRRAESDIAWVRYQADFDNQTAYILSILGEMDRKAEIAARKDAAKFITAVDGDTWETLSTRATGGPSAASQIRAMAGARYGELPVSGESYLTP